MYTTLVDVSTLVTHIGDPRWVVFDCRHDLVKADAGAQAYAAGHLPGARYASVETVLSGMKTGQNGRHPLPERADFINFLRESGVSDDSQVIAYDADSSMWASRLWWLMRWIGHEQVAVLDGGMAAWLAARAETSTVVPEARRGNFAGHGALVATVDAPEILAEQATQRWQLVDARAPERYRGEVEFLDRAPGHIPGALNRPFGNNLVDGRFKSAAVLAAEWQELLGARDPSEVVHQCGSGVSACHNLLAMEIAGLPSSRLYPGSWSEWCSDPARPIATGPNP